MSSSWTATGITLAYRLGEITLFKWQRNGFACADHFTARTVDRVPVAPDEDVTRTNDGPFLYRSHPVPDALPRWSVSGPWIRYVPRQYKRYYVDLQGGFDAYMGRFSSKSRSTLLRKVRKLAEAGGGEIEWKEYRSPEQLMEFHRFAGELSRRTYQERLLDAGLPEGEPFKQEMTAAAGRSRVRAYLLFLKGEPAAYVYCPLDSGILSYEFVEYDPAHQHMSPGTVLQYLILKKLFEEGGYRIFDFTEGEGQQKSFFATHHVDCADIYFYRKTTRNLLAVKAHSVIDTLSERTGDALDRMGLKAAVRRLVRKAA